MSLAHSSASRPRDLISDMPALGRPSPHHAGALGEWNDTAPFGAGHPEISEAERAAADAQLARVGTPIVVVSHERSGTHLTIDLIRKQFAEAKPRRVPGESPNNAYFSVDRFFPGRVNWLPEDRAVKLMRKATLPTIKTHAFPDLHEVLPEHQAFVDAIFRKGKLIYVVRDPRKVMCSMHPYLQFREEARVPFAQWLRSTDTYGVTPIKRWAQHVMAWATRPDVLVVDYEDMVKRPAKAIECLASHLELKPLMVEPMLPKPMKGKLSKLMVRLGFDLESTNVTASGRPTPKPHEVFDEALEAFLVSEASEAMELLGYPSRFPAKRATPSAA